jgi:ferredoxin
VSAGAGRGRRRPSWRLRLDPIACDGRGLCAELLPELVELDDWGFPIVSRETVPDEVLAAARRAASACPTLALRLERLEREDARRVR